MLENTGTITQEYFNEFYYFDKYRLMTTLQAQDSNLQSFIWIFSFHRIIMYFSF